MVTLCTTRFVTVALLAILAHPIHARWNVYSRFLDADFHPIFETSYDVGNPGCFSPGKIESQSLITFSKTWTNTQTMADGAYCLLSYTDRCTKEDMEGNDQRQFHHVRLTGKTKFHNTHGYRVCKSPDECDWKAFKWITGNCTHPSEIIDGKNNNNDWILPGWGNNV